MSIVTFEDVILGSVSDELRALGPAFATTVIVHCQDVHTGRTDHRTLQPFAMYVGIPMFRAQVGQSLAIYAVEVDADGDLDVSIMFAGSHGVPVVVASLAWDGVDDDALRVGILDARARAHFN